MPSALETLVKILKLEQETGYKNTAVIGGLESFVEHWVQDAHQQAKRPEHHQLIDELEGYLRRYGEQDAPKARHEVVKYMLGRIMGRVPAPSDLPPSTYAQEQSAAPSTTPPLTSEKRTPASPPSPRKTTPTATIAASAPFRPPRRRYAALEPQEAAERYAALQAPVTTLPRVGEKMAQRLEKLGIRTVADMLLYFPRRYDDYSKLRTLNRLRPGETVTVIAAVRSVAQRVATGKRAYLFVTVDDGTGLLNVAFFGQPWLQKQFKRGSMVVLSGKVELFRGQPTMTNPEWEMLERENLHVGRIVPVYGLTRGISARTMRRLVRQVVTQWATRIPEHLPLSVLERADLADLSWALQQVHFPDSFEALEYARRRLTFDELFLFQMEMQAQRRAWQSVPGQPLRVPDEWLESALAALPYTLTAAQRRALEDIRADLARDVPMSRLLQGDVGSGKTAVAALALGMAVRNGKQAALMAPTSILAEQHARTLADLLGRLPEGEQITLRLLTGRTSAAEREEIYAGLADGSVQVVVGTHALIQEGVQFHDLALAVIDEQHRFGVEQRAALRSKGTHPHVLVMTATPIPRTLALTLYADLDLSVIDELPPGRTPVETRVLTSLERERAYTFIRAQVERGRQAFIIYPLVETSEALQELGSATEQHERLQKEIFPDLRVGLVHGRMSPSDKEAVMAAFAAGELDILVATAVVEVGVDVPNANVILIESAERFGLAQLHQFRGRVGRGEHKSFCLLVNTSNAEEAAKRLAAIEATTDGFRLAELDWQLRGPGDLLGVRQSGMTRFRLAEQINPKLVELAQREARTVYAEDPQLQHDEHALLAQKLHGPDQLAEIS